MVWVGRVLKDHVEEDDKIGLPASNRLICSARKKKNKLGGEKKKS